MVLQRAGGSAHIANTVVHHSQDVFIPPADVDDLGNADISQRLMGLIERIDHHSNFVHKATVDGVTGTNERAQMEENSYQAIVKFQGHVTLLYRVFCVTEKSDVRECAAPDALANNSPDMEK